MPQKVTHPGRHAALVSLAGSLRRRGLSARVMLPTLLAFNAAHCDPPKDEAEVHAIAEGVERLYEAGSFAAGVTGTDSTDGTDSAPGGTGAAAGALPPAMPFPVDALPEIPRRLVLEGPASHPRTMESLNSLPGVNIADTRAGTITISIGGDGLSISDDEARSIE